MRDRLASWLIFFAVLLLGFWGHVAQAADGVPASALEDRTTLVLPKRVPAPLLAAGFAGKGPGEQFVVGQGIGAGLIGLGWLGLSVGVIGVTGDSRYGAIGGAFLAGTGGVLAMVGSGTALGAATALRNQGQTVSLLPGWIAVGAGAVGLGLLAASPADPRFAVAGLLTVPVIVAAGTVQLVLNGRAARRLVLSGGPTAGGGGMGVMTLRF